MRYKKKIANALRFLGTAPILYSNCDNRSDSSTDRSKSLPFYSTPRHGRYQRPTTFIG